MFWLTWKIEVHEPELLKNSLAQKKTVLFAHFHGDELVLLALIGKYRIATISSQSLDGEMMNSIIYLQGGITSRGSSTRGGVQALKGLLKLLKNNNRNSSFAVDGPKGPIYKAKPGVFEVSRLTNAPIYFGGVYCDRAFHFPKSWNKTFFPKPFAKIQIVWTGPWGPCDKNIDPRETSLLEHAEQEIHKARKTAKDLFDHKLS